MEHTDLIIEVINRTSDGICTGGGVPKSKDRAFSNGHLGNSDGMGKRQVREVGLTLTFLIPTLYFVSLTLFNMKWTALMLFS